MIDKEYKRFNLECDCCEDGVENLETHQDAIDYMQENNWISVNEHGIWYDYCEKCKKGFE